jgi:hypothetical protein
VYTLLLWPLAKQTIISYPGLNTCNPDYPIKKKIPSQFLEIYYSNRIGGIIRTSTVLNEMAETIHPDKINSELVQSFYVSTIQRLAYILEIVLKAG